ncbi:MAG TPA: CBS domain-containing protein, partial [Pseudonocardiaceae bacterium]
GHHAQPVRTAPAPTRPAVVADLAHPAAMIPHDTTGEAARELFADRPELTGLVLVDDHQRPVLSLNRDRFMLAITGPFGHSLYARRRAADLGDLPRTLGMGASLAEAIDMVADTNAQRMYDDIVVVDGPGRCHGVLRIGDLVRDMAQRQSAPPRRPQPSPRAS